MEPKAKHIPADELKDLFERSGLSIEQLSRLLGGSVRTTFNELGGHGLSSAQKLGQYESLAEAVAEFELEAIQELTPLVAFNSPKLAELVRKKLLSSKHGRSVFHRIMADLPQNQVLQVSPLSVRDRLGVS